MACVCACDNSICLSTYVQFYSNLMFPGRGASRGCVCDGWSDLRQQRRQRQGEGLKRAHGREIGLEIL